MQACFAITPCRALRSSVAGRWTSPHMVGFLWSVSCFRGPGPTWRADSVRTPGHTPAEPSHRARHLVRQWYGEDHARPAPLPRRWHLIPSCAFRCRNAAKVIAGCVFQLHWVESPALLVEGEVAQRRPPRRDRALPLVRDLADFACKAQPSRRPAPGTTAGDVPVGGVRRCALGVPAAGPRLMMHTCCITKNHGVASSTLALGTTPKSLIAKH